MAGEPENGTKDERHPAQLEPYIGFWATVFRTIARAPGTYSMGILGSLMLLVIVGIIGWVLLKDDNVLKDLSEPANARGIITFIISFTAIGVALILILHSLFGNSKLDQFRQAREIYAGLMGILGTIVGFYFGSSEKTVPPLTLTEPKFVGREIVAHATGGVAPYRYHITPDSLNDSAGMGERVSQDGWVQTKLKSAQPDTLALRIEIWDSKNTQVTKDLSPVKANKSAAKPVDAAAAKSEAKADSTGGSHFPKGK